MRVLVLLLLVPAWAGPAALDNSQASMGSEPTSLVYDVEENCIFDPGPDLLATGGPTEIFGGEHGLDHIQHLRTENEVGNAFQEYGEEILGSPTESGDSGWTPAASTVSYRVDGEPESGNVSESPEWDPDVSTESYEGDGPMEEVVTHLGYPPGLGEDVQDEGFKALQMNVTQLTRDNIKYILTQKDYDVICIM